MSRGRGKGSYGGFLTPFFNGIKDAIARQILVQAGRKKAYRGGARIKPMRRMVQGKDKPTKER